jgi:hypothetical protein
VQLTRGARELLLPMLLAGQGCSGQLEAADGGALDGTTGDQDHAATEAGVDSSGPDGNPISDGATGDSVTEEDAPTGDGPCVGQTGGACLACCKQVHAEGNATASAATYGCLCDGSVCASACSSSYCVTGVLPDAATACGQCEVAARSEDGDGGACYHAILTACQADPDCVALVNCDHGCP